MSDAERVRSANAFARMLRFIRFSHTIFALPFAIASMLVAARGLPPARLIGWILIAMVAARTAAMAFNRVVDWEIDQLIGAQPSGTDSSLALQRLRCS